MFAIVQLALTVLIIIGFWKIFEKAGRPGWESIVPFYNLWILVTKVINKPWFWFLIALIPIVGGILIGIEVAKAFGKTAGYGVGLGLLPFVFYPMLGFGDDKYVGTAPGGFPVETAKV